MSAADTSIYDSLIRPVKPEGPLDMATKAADLGVALQRSQLLPAEIQQRQQEAEELRLKNQTTQEDTADQKTLQDLYGQVQTDPSIPPEKKLDELRTRAAGKVKPRTLEALSKSVQEHQDAMQKAHDDQLKQIKAVGEEVGNTAQGILSADPAARPALYAQERARLIRSGVAPPDQIPEQYDENYLRSAVAHAQGATNAATAEISRREQAVKDADEARKARTEELATAGQTIDGVQDQAGYDAWRAKLSPANKALTAATFTPQNVATIKRMALTADQQRQAEQASTTAAETNRHNLATEGDKPGAKTYTGEMRAALVAGGAKDPDNPSQPEAAAALKILKPGEISDKPVTKGKLIEIENTKAQTILKSKLALNKVLEANPVSKKTGLRTDPAAVEQAWEDHIERLQDAQLGYEHELTAATGNDVGHNDWADRLRAPGKGEASPAGTPAGAGPSVQGAKPANPTGALPPRPPSIPRAAQAQYNPARKQWRYSTDGGKSWQQPPGQ